MDFLAILPYLKDGAIVCLHDVAMQQYFYDAPDAHATGVLFAAVSGEKYLSFVPKNLNPTDEYPNIAAFRVTEETRKNIADVFVLPSAQNYAAYQNQQTGIDNDGGNDADGFLVVTQKSIIDTNS